MQLIPDPNSANIDPFFEETTLILTCDVIEPSDGKAYDRDPRSIAKRAEAYLKASGLGDTAYFGPGQNSSSSTACAGAQSPTTLSTKSKSTKPLEHRLQARRRQPRPPSHRQGRLFPVPPVDSARKTCARNVPDPRIPGHSRSSVPPRSGRRWPERNRHPFSTLVSALTGLQLQKYVIHNVANACGKTATFMPKPYHGDNGSGMHVHQSVWKDGKNLFAGDGYARPVRLRSVLHRRHHQARPCPNAITNPGTNSHKRLVPHSKTPVVGLLAKNRSASIRIPYVANPKGRRVEARFPDPLMNPYLAFSP